MIYGKLYVRSVYGLPSLTDSWVGQTARQDRPMNISVHRPVPPSIRTPMRRGTMQTSRPPCPPPPTPHQRQVAEHPERQHQPLLRMRSHNLNKQPPEQFIHADLHKGWDILFYQEITHAPLLPFGWSPLPIQPKMFSSVLPTRAEGSCLVIASRLAPYVFEIPSPCPEALCTAALHLPGQPPVLLVSVYAQSPRRPEIERELNKLFGKYPLWILGGDFNAQLTPLDTNGSTVNRWNWLSSLIEDKREGVDSFRSKHQNTLQFTRYRSTLLPCDTHIDLFLLSSRLLMLPFLTLDSADICVQDTTSDHHPTHCALQLPCTPQYLPPPPQHTLFRRLTQAEIREFTSKLSPLEEWAKNIPMDQVSLDECVQWMNTVTQQVANAYDRITRPSAQHRETRMEREFKQALASVPSTTEGRKKTLRKLQDLNERWTKKRTEKEKKRLHYCMINGRKIKKAVDQALNPQQRTQVHLWDESTDPPNLATEPPQVGRVFSECLSKLGGEPDFEVPDQLLDQFISHIPKCPADVGAQPLPLPELSWLRSTTARASPSKATGEDEVNYYVISLCPEHLQAFILSAIHLVLRHAPPPRWAKARVCLLYKKGDPKKASNYRPICLIQSIVKLASV